MTTDTAAPIAAGAPAPAGEDANPTPGFVVEGGEPTVGTEAKPTEGAAEGEPKAGEGADDEGKKAEAQGAPETYADFTVPDGVALDAELLAEFVPVLKELNLSQENAQKLVDFAPKLISQAVEGIKAELIAEAKGWHLASRQDKEIGGDKMAEKLSVANKAIETFGTPELKAFLASKGLNAHPELIRAFYRAGKTLKEDVFVPGGGSPRGGDPAKVLYPNNA